MNERNSLRGKEISSVRPFKDLMDIDEEAADNGEDEGEEEFWNKMEEGEECVSAKYRSASIKPSAAEVEMHEMTHVPFRSWCKHCVAGKAKSYPHKSGAGDEGSIPKVSMDYMFMGDEDNMPILVIKCGKSKYTFAFVVPGKGKHSYSIRRCVESLKFLGYLRTIWKSDQEASIVALKDAVKNEIGHQVEVVTEESPVCESQSNGEIEVAKQW